MSQQLPHRFSLDGLDGKGEMRNSRCSSACISEAPPSFGQQRMWLLQERLSEQGTYNQPVAYRLTGRLDKERLRMALGVIMKRHEVLRTALVHDGCGLIQRIHPAGEIALVWEEEDLRELPPEPRTTVIDQRLEAEARRPFDLSRAPLWRVLLLTVDTDEFILLLNFHHSLIDVWSLRVFFKECSQLYASRSAELPALTIQYADYSARQRGELAGEVLARVQEYWRGQLAAPPPPLDLPAARTRIALPSGRGAVHRFRLPRTLATLLLDLARGDEVSIFRLMLAAFKVWLYRCCAQDDIIVGTPVADRGQPEVRSLVGFFLNTLPIRTRLDGGLTFRQLMKRVGEQVQGALDHACLPYEQIAELAAQERDVSQAPLFRTMFVLVRDLAPEWSLPEADVRVIPVHTGTSKADLSFTVHTASPDWECELEYATDLFTADHVARMASQLEELLHSIVVRPDETIGRLNLMPEEERHRLLFEWNDTRMDYPQDKCVHQLFEEQVERTPDAVAVVFGNQSLTYRELNRRSNQVSHHLRAAGVGPDVPVGLCAERSLEMVVGMLGILKAGGAYVPLDPSYPEDRLGFILEDTSAPVLLLHRSSAGGLPRYRGKVLQMERIDEESAGQSPPNPTAVPTADHLAYVIHTSGSTGRPKGVMISHRALVNHMCWIINQFGFSTSDRILQKTPISFDASVWEFHAPLLSGGCLVMAPVEAHRDPELLVSTMLEQKITVVQFVPTLLEVVIKEPRWPQCRSVRQVFCGGEALAPRLVAGFSELHPAQLHNLYGPTEATIDATFFTCALSEGKESIPIGRPVANLEVYVLDANRQPVPMGVKGELYIGGAGLARGYWGQPGLTAERFVQHPFRQPGAARLYRTGDLGRHRADGNIEYLGRMDRQVKLRGFRIELGEIESVLGGHPDVEQSAVVVREDKGGNRRIVAYVVGREGASPTPDVLRKALRNTLPEYMIPAAYVMLDSLPLTPNGKVDREYLLQMKENETEAARHFAPPRNSVEETLVRIWQEVLRQKRVGVTDNFFEIGGDSIISLQIIARASQEGLLIAPSQIFRNPTIEELAARVRTTGAVSREGETVAGSAPLTPIQHWFFEQDLTEKHHFNQAFLFAAPANLDLALLDRSFTRVIAHHDALRMRFTRGDSGWVQEYTDPKAVSVLRQVDLASVAAAEQQAEMERVAALTEASLDLGEPPLMRAVWFHLGHDQAARLLIVVHHLVVDGVSWRILLEDLETAYLSLLEDQLTPLPPKTHSFKRWAESLQRHADSAGLDAELAYWSACLAGVNEPRSDGGLCGEDLESSAHTVNVALDANATTILLREVSAAYNTRINDLLLTALARTFATWSGERVLHILLEGHGREDLFEGMDVSRTVGWFTSLFPVRLELPEAPWSPGSALVAVKEQLRGIPQRGIGYGMLRYLRNNPILAGRREPEILFNYLGQFDQIVARSRLFRFARESTGPWCSPRARRRHAIEVNCVIIEGRLECQWTYSEHRHLRKTMEQLSAGFIAGLEELIAHCSAPGVGGYTASDFPESGLSNDDLDDLMKQLG
jgi:amino acid adenylation domain-containing protein/non-ribosomal peptide synthase protein (TIGR01720 family)